MDFATILALIISAISLLLAAYTGLSSLNRNRHIDTREDSASITTLLVRLESINIGIVEIKTEMTGIKSDIKENRERIIKVEESAKQAHRRIDSLTEK